MVFHHSKTKCVWITLEKLKPTTFTQGRLSLYWATVQHKIGIKLYSHTNILCCADLLSVNYYVAVTPKSFQTGFEHLFIQNHIKHSVALFTSTIQFT